MTRKGTDTTWPHPRSESRDERAEHGPEAHREARLPEGEGRDGSDFMDYSKEDGGPTRRLVHRGPVELDSEREGARENP